MEIRLLHHFLKEVGFQELVNMSILRGCLDDFLRNIVVSSIGNCCGSECKV